MTNEELIAKIKAEVERLENYYTSVEWYVEALLSFLSTLEEQPKEVRNPIFDECVSRVDPEVREEVRRNIDFEQELYNHFGQIKDFTLGMHIGQYFYELGCTRTAEKYDEIEYNRQRAEEKPMDLGERIGSYNIVPYIDDKIAKLQDMWREEKVSFDWDDLKDMIEDVARHFAQWGAEHTPLPEDTVLFNKGVAEGRRLERDEFEKNRLAACSNQTEEEYDRETDFALGIIKKEHRQPTFSDAINYGMRLQKEQDERIYREFFNERNQGNASFRDLLAYKEGHSDGMEEQKEQMMKEARNHFVYNILSGNDMKKMIEIYNDEADCKPGDVVRVIIFKKEDEK